VEGGEVIQPKSVHRCLSLSVATGFGVGFLPVAPGTWGTILGFLLFLPMQKVPLLYALFAWTILFGTGVYASHVSIGFFGEKDPSRIVIDEIAAIFLVLFLLPASILWQLSGFLLFRLFDITKPPLVREAESLPGGWGIMADDLMAAIYTILILQFTHYIVWSGPFS
jgi:phosphatidylglycerophosphatase A